MNSFKKYIVTGLLAILPAAFTWIIIVYLYNIFTSPGSYVVSIVYNFLYGNQFEINDYLINFLSFLFTLFFIYIFGFVTNRFIGKSIMSLFDRLVLKIPVAKTIYKTIKQLTNSIADTQANAFEKVVSIEYPKKGIWTIAMVTGQSIDKNNIEYYHLFLPTTPNPTSGFMLIVKKSDVIESKMNVEEGLKTIISGGMVAPEINDL
tara:strand:+ start:298 stop:912 length:615 start_codon:yes stop_codon:yes gene_type:complete